MINTVLVAKLRVWSLFRDPREMFNIIQDYEPGAAPSDLFMWIPKIYCKNGFVARSAPMVDGSECPHTNW